MIRFKSYKQPDTIGYLYDDSFASRSSASENDYYRWPMGYVGRFALQFPTFGDGLTMHGPEYHVSRLYTPDYYYSLGKHLLEFGTETDEDLTDLGYTMSSLDHLDKTFSFYLSLRYQEGSPPKYYSPELLKTGSDKKRHDRRYHQVENWMNGSVESALRLALVHHQPGTSPSFTTAIRYLDRIRIVSGYSWFDSYEFFRLKDSFDEEGGRNFISQSTTAIHIVENYMRSIWARGFSERLVTSYEQCQANYEKLQAAAESKQEAAA